MVEDVLHEICPRGGALDALIVTSAADLPARHLPQRCGTCRGGICVLVGRLGLGGRPRLDCARRRAARLRPCARLLSGPAAFLRSLPALLAAAALRRRACRRRVPARASSSATASSSVIVSGVLSLRQRGVDAVVADIGSVAAVLGDDRAALVGMLAERPAGIGAEAAALPGPCASSPRSASPRG